MPKVVILEVGDPIMSNLIYISLGLGIAKFLIDIINFILLKLGWYHFMRMEKNEFRERISNFKAENRELKNELFNYKIELGSLRKRIREIEKNK